MLDQDQDQDGVEAGGSGESEGDMYDDDNALDLDRDAGAFAGNGGDDAFDEFGYEVGYPHANVRGAVDSGVLGAVREDEEEEESVYSYHDSEGDGKAEGGAVAAGDGRRGGRLRDVGGGGTSRRSIRSRRRRSLREQLPQVGAESRAGTSGTGDRVGGISERRRRASRGLLRQSTSARSVVGKRRARLSADQGTRGEMELDSLRVKRNSFSQSQSQGQGRGGHRGVDSRDAPSQNALHGSVH